jgi:hypothetical protein
MVAALTFEGKNILPSPSLNFIVSNIVGAIGVSINK